MDPVIIGLVIGMLAVMAVSVTFMARLEWLLLLAIVTIMFADTYLFPNEADSAAFYYTRFIPLGLVALRSLMASKGSFAPARSLPGVFLKPFGLLCLLAAFATSYSDHPLKNAMRALSMALVLISFGVGIPSCMPDNAALKRGLRTIVMILGVIILISLVTYPVMDHPVMDLGDYVRVKGPFKNPNTLGLLCMLAFFPLAAMWWEDRRQRFVGVLALAAVMGIVLSGSRGSFIGLLTGLMVVTVFRGLDRKLKGAIVTVIAVGLVSLIFLPGLQGLMRTDTGLRFDLWQRAYQIGMRSPVAGTTFGDVDEVFDADKEYLQSIDIYSAGSHNEYMRMFVAVGLPGLLLALFGLFSIVIRSFRSIKYGGDPIIQVSLLAAVSAGMVNAVFEDWLFAFGGAPSLPFWIFLAVLSIYIHRYSFGGKAISRQPQSIPSRIPVYPQPGLARRGVL